MSDTGAPESTPGSQERRLASSDVGLASKASPPPAAPNPVSILAPAESTLPMQDKGPITPKEEPDGFSSPLPRKPLQHNLDISHSVQEVADAHTSFPERAEPSASPTTSPGESSMNSLAPSPSTHYSPTNGIHSKDTVATAGPPNGNGAEVPTSSETAARPPGSPENDTSIPGTELISHNENRLSDSSAGVMLLRESLAQAKAEVETDEPKSPASGAVQSLLIASSKGVGHGGGSDEEEGAGGEQASGYEPGAAQPVNGAQPNNEILIAHLQAQLQHLSGEQPRGNDVGYEEEEEDGGYGGHGQRADPTIRNPSARVHPKHYLRMDQDSDGDYEEEEIMSPSKMMKIHESQDGEYEEDLSPDDDPDLGPVLHQSLARNVTNALVMGTMKGKYLEVIAGPGKHQVKDFNILPINVLRVNYDAKDEDYIIIRLMCDPKMKLRDRTIFVTAVSAKHAADDDSEIILQNLKISKEMLQGRTKGFKFHLTYTVVSGGIEEETIKSKSFYIWSNVKQTGFPRNERDKYLEQRKLVNRGKRKR